MPAGELLADEVAKVLHIRTPKTVNEITAELTGMVSKRAVRYAVMLLVKAGRAKTTGARAKGIEPKHNRQRYRVLAVMQEGRADAA